ncbi:TIR domain-containing protein [Plesiomonas shigelloides]|uniref:TIR domain-containing protein n=1 Tax=Plesiomonas shigelloides TaxID=703 RepID=UPI001C437A0A
MGRDKESVGFYDASVFEASQKESDNALKNFLRDGLKNTSVTCVLAGQYTASRCWVRYEIVRSVLKGNGLLTVDIHGVKNNANILGKKESIHFPKSEFTVRTDKFILLKLKTVNG